MKGDTDVVMKELTSSALGNGDNETNTYIIKLRSIAIRMLIPPANESCHHEQRNFYPPMVAREIRKSDESGVHVHIARYIQGYSYRDVWFCEAIIQQWREELPASCLMRSGHKVERQHLNTATFQHIPNSEMSFTNSFRFSLCFPSMWLSLDW